MEAGRYGGGYGVALGYYLPLPRLALVTVGAGVNGGVSGDQPRTPAWGGNLFVAWGAEHRALLLLGYALNDRRVLRLHGSNAVDRSLWGAEASFELRAGERRRRHGARAGGTAYRPDAVAAFSDRFERAFTVALGWKLW